MTSAGIGHESHRAPAESVSIRLLGSTCRFTSADPRHVSSIRDSYVGLVCGAADPPDVWVEVDPSHEDVPGTRVVRHRERVLITGRDTFSEAFGLEVRGYLQAIMVDHVIRSGTALQVHASAVVADAGAVVFLAPAKNGKTTFALLACLAGFGYLAQEITVLTLQPSGVEVSGIPQPFKLASTAAAWFQQLQAGGPDPSPDSTDDRSAYLRYHLQLGEKAVVPYHEVANVAKDPVALSHLVFLYPSMLADAPEWETLPAEEAALRMSMLCELPLKPGLDLSLTGEDFLNRIGSLCAAATVQASCTEFRWCPDHDRNLAALRTVLARTPVPAE